MFFVLVGLLLGTLGGMWGDIFNDLLSSFGPLIHLTVLSLFSIILFYFLSNKIILKLDLAVKTLDLEKEKIIKKGIALQQELDNIKNTLDKTDK